MFKAGVTLEGLDRALRLEQARIERIEAQRIKQAAEGLKNELRAETARALGPKIAGAWQSRFYKDDNAGFVYSKAPKIIDFNMHDRVVRPVGGARFLAIPTRNVPRRGKRRMTVEEVQDSFNQELTLANGKRGSKLGFIEAVRAKSKRRPGVRAATEGRVAQGRAVERILMFVFVPWVRGRKIINPDAIFRRWADRTARDFEHDLAMEG